MSVYDNRTATLRVITANKLPFKRSYKQLLAYIAVDVRGEAGRGEASFSVIVRGPNFRTPHARQFPLGIMI